MSQNNDVPPEFDIFLATHSDAPEDVREMWRYAIFLLLLDTEKARILGMHQDGENLHIAVETLDGQQLSIVRPNISDELEQKLLETVRALFDEERAVDDAPLAHE